MNKVEIPTGRRDGRISAAANVRPNIIDTSFTLDSMAKIFSVRGFSIDTLLPSQSVPCRSSHYWEVSMQLVQRPVQAQLERKSHTDRLIPRPAVRGPANKNVPSAAANEDLITVNNDSGIPFQFDSHLQDSVGAQAGCSSLIDSALLNDARTRNKVVEFAGSQESYFQSWAVSFLKHSNIRVRTKDEGEILSCSMPSR